MDPGEDGAAWFRTLLIDLSQGILGVVADGRDGIVEGLGQRGDGIGRIGPDVAQGHGGHVAVVGLLVVEQFDQRFDRRLADPTQRHGGELLDVVVRVVKAIDQFRDGGFAEISQGK